VDKFKPKDVSQDPDVSFENDLQADPGLREGTMPRGRLVLLLTAAIVVVIVVLWVIMATR